MFPSLSLDMIEVGESTGALPAMLTSVAEFYEDDVSTRVTASLTLIEPAHDDLHGPVYRVRTDLAVSADFLAGGFDARLGGKVHLKKFNGGAWFGKSVPRSRSEVHPDPC